MKKIITSGFNHQIADIKTLFKKNANWNIVCDISLKKDFSKEKNCLNFTPMSLRKGFFDYSYFAKIYNVPTYLVRDLLSDIYQFNLILEDKSGSEFTNEQRVNFYHDNLRFFYNLYKNLNPDIIFFWELPHTSENYVLYKLAKKMNIKTLIKHDIKLLKRSFISDDLLISKIPILDNKIKTITDDQNIIEKNVKIFEVPEHIKFYISKVKNINFKHFLNFKEAEIAIKKCIKPKSFFSNFGYQIFKISMIIKNFQSYLFYRFLCKKYLIIDKKTVIFFSNFQPEATSNIWAPIFAHQEVAIQMLSDGLPPGWKIAYKEYPKHLVHPTGRIYYNRHKEYFKRLKKIKNVYFLDDRANNKNIIDMCGAVASINGTVGWEALNNNKATLIFGDIWYKDCPGTSTITSSSQCLQILRDLENTEKLEKKIDQKVKYFRDKLVSNTYELFFDKFDYEKKLSEKNLLSILDKFKIAIKYYEKRDS